MTRSLNSVKVSISFLTQPRCSWPTSTPLYWNTKKRSITKHLTIILINQYLTFYYRVGINSLVLLALTQAYHFLYHLRSCQHCHRHRSLDKSPRTRCPRHRRTSRSTDLRKNPKPMTDSPSLTFPHPNLTAVMHWKHLRMLRYTSCVASWRPTLWEFLPAKEVVHTDTLVYLCPQRRSTFS